MQHDLVLQVISLCEKQRDPPLKYVIVDTPGQIEIFTWSASGAIITEAFASGFPTMIAFIIDTPRCAHPQTFMSNMLQVCLQHFMADICSSSRRAAVLMFVTCHMPNEPSMSSN